MDHPRLSFHGMFSFFFSLFGVTQKMQKWIMGCELFDPESDAFYVLFR